MWAIITGIVSFIGLAFMIFLTVDLFKRYKSSYTFMKNSPNRWAMWWEWFFFLTIILLILTSLPSD